MSNEDTNEKCNDCGEVHPKELPGLEGAPPWVSGVANVSGNFMADLVNLEEATGDFPLAVVFVARLSNGETVFATNGSAALDPVAYKATKVSMLEVARQSIIEDKHRAVFDDAPAQAQTPQSVEAKTIEDILKMLSGL